MPESSTAGESGPESVPEPVDSPHRRKQRPWTTPLDFRHREIAAPMVRISSLAYRMTCRFYCPSVITYSEELVDKKVIGLRREWNEDYQTIEYFEPNDVRPAWATCDDDYPVIFQLGTNNAQNAVKAALRVIDDVEGIDVNMGCPKHFSVHSGMGSGLLKKPDVAYDILTSLRRNISHPKTVTCKVRLLETVQQTIDFLRLVESTGVDAIAVHLRYVPQRTEDHAHWDQLPILMDSVSCPLIANGSLLTREKITDLKDQSGVPSVMVATGAICNPSIFGSNPHRLNLEPDLDPAHVREASFDEVLWKYLEYVEKYDNFFSNTKYTIGRMMTENSYGADPDYQLFCKAKNYKDLKKVFVDRRVRKGLMSAPIDESSDCSDDSS